MENSDFVDKLLQFGLTRQEATIYIAMAIHGELTGYEAAKLTGISNSNAYNSLATLVEKGAAYTVESAVTKYIAVPIDDFCSNKIRQLNQIKDYLIKKIPSAQIETESYMTIEGERHVIDKIKNMLEQAKERIYLCVPDDLIELFIPEIRELIDKKRKVVIITNKEIAIDGAFIYIGEKKENQIRLITDSSYALTGEIGTGENSSGLYSNKKNFVHLFKESLRNEIRLIEITGGES